MTPLIQAPGGMHYTLVKSVMTLAAGGCSGALPGQLLRRAKVFA